MELAYFRGTQVKTAYFVNCVLRLNYKDLRLETHGIALLTLQEASGEVRSRTVQRFGQNSRFLELAYFRGTQVKTAYFVNCVLRLNYKDLRLETHGIALLTLQEASGEVRSRTVQRFGQNSRFLELAYFRGTQVKLAYFVNSVLRLNYKDLRLETHGIALLTLQEASGEVRSRTVQRFGQNSRFLELAYYFRGTQVKTAYFVNSVLRLNYKDLRLETHGIALLTLQEASGEVRSRTVQRFGQNSRFLELAYFRCTQVKTAYFCKFRVAAKLQGFET